MLINRVGSNTETNKITRDNLKKMSKIIELQELEFEK